ncbi:MAG: DNA polymerase III subunit delta' [Propionibacteriaceae bacterium]|jgi:DNA polymerase-3 subunit delta'|nr:DNA polymerase III subunit delta' [Propionibacteriaceae bacterium]
MTVWDALVGQSPVIETLQRAVSGADHAMTHAWLFTGPAGSGRSVAARAFAAGLQCDHGGCGQCQSCQAVLAGNHPDVAVVATERLSLGVDEIKALVRDSVMAPAVGRWQIIIIEDADRLTDKGGDALLKAIEEPAPRTVWMLAAPTSADVLATIRSRVRQVALTTPSRQAIAKLLTAEGIDADQAQMAARICQGHIGRARAWARDPAVAERRRQALSLPDQLTDLGACLAQAEQVWTTAKQRADEITKSLDQAEIKEMATAYGLVTARGSVRGAKGQLKDLEREQSLRATRMQRDRIDDVLIELTGYYRDVLMVQLGTDHDLINPDVLSSVERLAKASSADQTVMRIDAIANCRRSLWANVAPQLALEAMMVALADLG